MNSVAMDLERFADIGAVPFFHDPDASPLFGDASAPEAIRISRLMKSRARILHRHDLKSL